MVLNHYKESPKHQESSHQLVLMNRQKKIEIQSNEAQDEQERDEFKTSEGTRREGPPFPINLSTKTQNPMVQLLLLEKRGRQQREGQRGPLEEMRVVSGSLAPGSGELVALLSLLTPLTL